MTVSSTINRVAYTGNGATTSFSFPYYFVNKSDLAVYVAGVLKVLNTDYTIAGTAPFPSGQNVVFGAAPANGASVVIVRVVPYTQTLDLVENDPLPAEDVEKRFDLTTMMIQQLVEQFARTVTLSITSLQSNITLSDLTASRALVTNAGATGIEMGPTVADITAAAANATAAAASAAAALASQNAAASSASAASTSASNASTSASTASTQATNASNSASAAATSATNAAKRPTTAVSGSKTFALGDADTYQRYTGTGGHTWTVPPHSSVAYPNDTEIDGFNATAFNVTMTATGGVTVNGVVGGSVTLPPYSGFNLKKQADNIWDYSGFGADSWV